MINYNNYMKSLFFTILISIFIYPAVAQDTTYYDQEHKITKLKTDANFYRVVIKNDNNYWVREFSKNGKIISDEHFGDGKYLIHHGVSKLFYANGQVEVERNYINNVLEDNLWVFYENGKVRRTDAYKNGKLVKGMMFDSLGNEIPYCGEHEVQPEFPGGNINALRFISKNIKFPKSAYRANVNGSVFIKFVVEADGSINEVIILKTLHPECDAEAVRVIKAMPKWTPGFQECKPIRVWFTLPINFNS
jgi:TonB family protein